MKTQKVRFRLHAHTAAEWATHAAPLASEPCWSTDTHSLRFGNGLDVWVDLPEVANSLDHARQHAVDAAADHTSSATPGKMLKAAATTGLPAEASNTDTEVASAVSLKHSNSLDHARQHAVDAAADHTSTATPGKMLKAAATTGLPTEASNTDAEVADAVAKRNCRSVGTTSTSTPTPSGDTTDLYYLSALAVGATFGAVTGSTLVDGQKLVIRILDNGVAQTLAWNSGTGGYIARGVALPTTTVAGKYLYVGFIYNAIAGKWDCVASSQEA